MHGQRRGSPPLTRERRIATIIYPFISRITPAYAGKTHRTKLADGNLRDHPRLRGKDEFGLFASDGVMGSPPLTRERLLAVYSDFLNFGITPAYAGKTLRKGHSAGVERDHPRLRGKDIDVSKIIPWQRGSPPLTRERLFLLVGQFP